MAQSKTLLWFRQDLRLRDNPALVDAVCSGQVLPVYILDDVHAGKWTMGAASRWWLHHALSALDESLGHRLSYCVGDPLRIIPEICRAQGIQQVNWNRCYEPWQIKRDQTLQKALEQNTIKVNTFNASLLWEPWTVFKKDASPYRVFTPYYKNGCRSLPEPRLPLPAPERPSFAGPLETSQGLSALQLLPEKNWDAGFTRHWQPGETGAGDRLSVFVREHMADYPVARDQPAIEGTSMLSAHLHFGEVSPHQAWHAAQQSACRVSAREHFQRELAWREFSYYLLYHFPDLPEKNFNPVFDAFPWRGSKACLKRWQQGQTGIPIVDAGMRQLWQTGYMHNRVRMIVASFLVKNLLIHWREGAAWFWDCLLDADLANNSASWQWVAGSGADAAPYFRIFNPVLQGRKFDPDGEYVRHYCPELAALPARYIHCPWEADVQVLAQAGLRLGRDYPQPLVDLSASRQRALQAYKQMKSN